MKGLYTQSRSPYYWIRVYDKTIRIASKRSRSLNTKIPITPRDLAEIENARQEGRKPKLTGNQKISELVRNVRHEMAMKNIENSVDIELPRPVKFQDAFLDMIKDRSTPNTSGYIRPRTVEIYTLAAEHFQQACGNKDLDEYNSDINNKLAVYFTKKEFSNSTVSIITRTLKSTFAYFAKKKLIRENFIQAVRYQKDIIKIIPEAELEVIFAHFKKSDYKHHYVLIKFLALTGCRPSSAIVQPLADIDLKSGLMYITNVKAGHLKDVQKYAFPIYKELHDLLSEYIPTLDKKATRLFPQFAYKNRYLDSLKFWDRAIKQLMEGDPPIKYRYTLKQFRSTFASKLINQKKLDIFSVKKLLDHANIRTTEDHYVAFDTLRLGSLLE